MTCGGAGGRYVQTWRPIPRARPQGRPIPRPPQVAPPVPEGKETKAKRRKVRGKVVVGATGIVIAHKLWMEMRKGKSD